MMGTIDKARQVAGAGLFERAEALAKQRAEWLRHAAARPKGDPGRRNALRRARSIERVIVGIAEIIEGNARA